MIFACMSISPSSFVTPKIGLVVASASTFRLPEDPVFDVEFLCHGAFVNLPIDQCAVILSAIHLLQATKTFAISLYGSSDCYLSFQQPTGQFDGGAELIT